VNYFTLRIIVILMEIIKDLDNQHGLRLPSAPSTLKAKPPRHAPR
jgi:hypothetical protein